MKFLLLPCSLLIAMIGYAQKSSNPQPFAKIITAADLKKNLYVVAGPEMEGRETATAGQRKAAAFIENDFKELGLLPGNKDSYQLFYNVYQDSLAGASIEVNGKPFQLNKDFSLLPNYISATMRFSEFVLVGQNGADSLNNADVAGKLVVIMANTPAGFQGFRRIYNSVLQHKGIAAVAIVNDTYAKSGYYKKTIDQSLSQFEPSIKPQRFFISQEMAQALLDSNHVEENATGVKTYKANVLLDVQKVKAATLQSSDVVGILPGTDLKDQYVVISAHYDHLGKRGDSVIYYGADDDGSGTVSILQIAKAFAKAKAAGKGPRRSILFLANSGEEKGLWGSEYFTDHPTIPLDKTTVDLNIDMIGRTDSSRKQGDSSNYVYVVGDDKLSSDLHTISEAQNKKYTKMELDYKYNDPNDKEMIYYRSDHYNFAKNGVPIIFYYDGMLGADYHKPTDTPNKINYNLMAKRAQLVFYTAWDMANRDEMLKRDIPLDNSTANR